METSKIVGKIYHISNYTSLPVYANWLLGIPIGVARVLLGLVPVVLCWIPRGY